MPSLIKDKTTDVYKVRDRRGGRDIIQSLGTKDRDVASERYGKWLAANGGDRWREIQHGFDAAAEKLIAEHFPLIRPNSAKAYAFHLLVLKKHFGGKKLSEIGRADLYAYEQARRQAGVRPATILAELRVLSVAYGCAQDSEWIEVNPVRPYLRARKKKGLQAAAPQTRYLSVEEERRLLAEARGLSDWLCPYRDMLTAAIVLAIDTGLRSDELFGLPWTDVDLVRKEITVRASRAKSGKARMVPILPRAEKVLRGLQRHYASPYVLHREDGGRFANMRAMLARLVGWAGITPLRWHDLRRTCGCRLIQVHRLRMHEVSAWLGHASVRQTETTYAFLRVDELHAAVGTARGEETVNRTVEIEETVKQISALPNLPGGTLG